MSKTVVRKNESLDDALRRFKRTGQSCFLRYISITITVTF